MAENKQYITQIQENGNVMISEDVVEAIVEHAVSDVDGVAEISTKSGSEIADLFGVKNWGKEMKIVIAEDNSLTINCNILIKYGQSVVSVADAVQSSVTSAVESMTGVKVQAVNVNVCGIVRQ